MISNGTGHIISPASSLLTYSLPIAVDHVFPLFYFLLWCQCLPRHSLLQSDQTFYLVLLSTFLIAHPSQSHKVGAHCMSHRLLNNFMIHSGNTEKPICYYFIVVYSQPFLSNAAHKKCGWCSGGLFYTAQLSFGE